MNSLLSCCHGIRNTYLLYDLCVPLFPLPIIEHLFYNVKCYFCYFYVLGNDPVSEFTL